MAQIPEQKKPTVWVVYYSLYGHIRALAEQIAAGLEDSGVNVKVYQVPETLPKNVVELMHGFPQEKCVDKHPLLPFDEIESADGFLFGMPTRYGAMSAQFKTFWDRTGQLWQKGSLVGKMAGFFFSTSTQGGGQETTALTSITQLVHHGIIYVPLGYTTPLLQDMTEIHGGSPYGCGTYGIDNHPSELEKKVALHQGKHFGNIIKKYHGQK